MRCCRARWLRLGRLVLPGEADFGRSYEITGTLANLRLPNSCRALRKLVTSFFSIVDCANRFVWCIHRSFAARLRPGCLRTNRIDRGYRTCSKERDSDCRVRKTRVEKGRGLLEAALEGARLRRRPLLMTSMALSLVVCRCGFEWFRCGSAPDPGTVVVSGMLADTLIASFLIQ